MPLAKSRALWRVVSEIDLEAIQHEASRPFRVGIAADDATRARTLALLLSDDAADRVHPWITLLPADPPAAPAADIYLYVTSPSADPSCLAGWRMHARSASTPLVTIVVGSAAALDRAPHDGESARVGIPALTPAALIEVAPVVVQALPDGLRLSVARQLPPLRRPVFDALIDETARANAMYAMTTGVAESVPLMSVPLNVADIIVLTKNQLILSYRIALGAGKSGRARELLAEVVGVVGSGFLFRQGARQLVGLVPVLGILPKVAMAYAGTWAVGRAVAAWATHGEQVTAAAIRRFYREARERGQEVAQALVRRSRRLGKSRV